jgi:hypothetical protein
VLPASLTVTPSSMASVMRLVAVAPLSACAGAGDFAKVVVENAARKNNTDRQDTRAQIDLIDLFPHKNLIFYRCEAHNGDALRQVFLKRAEHYRLQACEVKGIFFSFISR